MSLSRIWEGLLGITGLGGVALIGILVRRGYNTSLGFSAPDTTQSVPDFWLGTLQFLGSSLLTIPGLLLLLALIGLLLFPPAKKLAVYMNRKPHLIAGLILLLCVGAIALPWSPLYPPADLAGLPLKALDQENPFGLVLSHSNTLRALVCGARDDLDEGPVADAFRLACNKLKFPDAKQSQEAIERKYEFATLLLVTIGAVALLCRIIILRPPEGLPAPVSKLFEYRSLALNTAFAICLLIGFGELAYAWGAVMRISRPLPNKLVIFKNCSSEPALIAWESDQQYGLILWRTLRPEIHLRAEVTTIKDSDPPTMGVLIYAIKRKIDFERQQDSGTLPPPNPPSGCESRPTAHSGVHHSHKNNAHSTHSSSFRNATPVRAG